MKSPRAEAQDLLNAGWALSDFVRPLMSTVSLHRDMRALLLILFLHVGPALRGAQAAQPPHSAQIQQWWSARSSEELTLEGEPQEVSLRGGEVAYVIPVGFYQRGRNFIWHSVLVRPSLEEVRENPSQVGSKVITVQDLDGDGVTEVFTASTASGGGTSQTFYSVVQFDGWEPVLLHQLLSEENLGDCGARGARLRPPLMSNVSRQASI